MHVLARIYFIFQQSNLISFFSICSICAIRKAFICNFPDLDFIFSIMLDLYDKTLNLDD